MSKVELILKYKNGSQEGMYIKIPHYMNLLHIADIIDIHINNRQRDDELNIMVFVNKKTVELLKKVHKEGYKEENFPFEFFIRPFGSSLFNQPITIFSKLEGK